MGMDLRGSILLSSSLVGVSPSYFGRW